MSYQVRDRVFQKDRGAEELVESNESDSTQSGGNSPSTENSNELSHEIKTTNFSSQNEKSPNNFTILQMTLS
jgi:hypothetical protein